MDGSFALLLASALAQSDRPVPVGAVRSADRLELGFTADGRFARIAHGARPFELEGGANGGADRFGGGLFVTDVAALGTPTAGESNRLANPSFEQDQDADSFPDSWLFADFWGSGGSATWDASLAHDGARSLRLDGSGGEAIESHSFAVTPGEELLLAAHHQGAAVRLVAIWVDATWQTLGVVLGDPEPAGSSFTPIARIVTAPPRAARLFAAWQKVEPGSCWIDAARAVTPAGRVHARLAAPLQADPSGRFARQRGTLAALDLDVALEWRGAAHGIVAAIDVADLRGGDRALEVELRLPLALGGALLQTEPRGTTRVERTNQWLEYLDLEESLQGLPFGDGRLANYSLLALSSATAGDPALAFGAPPGLAAPYRLRAATEPGGGLVLSFPIGLAPEPLAAPSRAHLAAFVAAADPRFPLRSGLEQQAALFPRLAERRFGPAGTWIAFTDPATIPNVADFGFAVHEGDNAVATDDALGIASFCYVEPWDDWVDLGDFATQPTYGDALARLAAQQSGVGYPPLVTSLARAVDVGGAHDASGAYHHMILQRPWISGSGWSCLVSCNPEAGLLDPLGRGWPAPFDHFAAIIDASAATWNALGATLEGAYLDSCTTYFADRLDLRRSNFATTRTPLTFARGSDAVALWPPAQVAAVAAAHAERERAAGRLLMGNAFTPHVRAAALHFDYLGIEANWGSAPESDATLLWRRVAAFRRPFCLLQNTDFAQFGHADMRRYMERCLFYGHFASCFSADAASFPYFEDPLLYERDRGLFQKYVPLVRELDLAGWRPVTHATTSHRDLLCERFGDASLGALPLFTLQNDGAIGRHATLAVDKTALALGTIGAVTDAITGQPLAFTQDALQLTVTAFLAPSAVRMVRLQ